MNGNFRLDRDILIAAGTAMISIIGICLVLGIGLRPDPEQAPVMRPTGTPFQYKLLATETYTPDPSLVTDLPEFPFEEATDDPGLSFPDEIDPFETPLTFPTLPEDSESFATDLPTDPAEDSQATDEPFVDDEAIFQEGKYDDMDYRIDYIGDWSSDYVDTAHEQSISSSQTMGNTASFNFVGRQVILGYLGSEGEEELGLATVVIDGNPYQLNESVGETWSSVQLAYGDHRVVITHQTGAQIYLDYIEVR